MKFKFKYEKKMHPNSKRTPTQLNSSPQVLLLYIGS